MAWTTVCGVNEVDKEDVLRFDHGDATYAIYRAPDGAFFASDGLCTHEQVHLADGFVMDDVIACPKHNGLFDYRSGAALGAPVCVNLRTYAVRVTDDHVEIDL